MDLAAFGIHHDGDGEALVVVEAPHTLDHLPVPLPRSVAHVDPRHVHPSDGQRPQLLKSTRGGAHRAHELGAARAAEAVLPELGLGDGVHLNGGGAPIRS